MSMNNISGNVYGRLTAIEFSYKKNKMAYWKCRCECGNVVFVQRNHLVSGHTKSCGCLKNKYNITNHRIFKIWCNMIDRCKNPNRKDSNCYFEKGISVCEEWKTYENFEYWSFANGYSNNLTIDRVDSNKDYEPSNCRWITIQEQQRNKCTNVMVTYEGETLCMSDWAKRFGINRATLESRIYDLGYSFEEAIKKKKGSLKTNVIIAYNGKEYTQSEFARLAGCTPQWVCQLCKKGLSAEEIMQKTEKLRKVEGV